MIETLLKIQKAGYGSHSVNTILIHYNYYLQYNVHISNGAKKMEAYEWVGMECGAVPQVVMYAVRMIRKFKAIYNIDSFLKVLLHIQNADCGNPCPDTILKYNEYYMQYDYHIKCGAKKMKAYKDAARDCNVNNQTVMVAARLIIKI
jgi:hypothetical protein